MASPLLGSLAATINGAMAFLFLDATLTRDVPVAGPDEADPLSPIQVSYDCKAIHEEYSERMRRDGTIKEGERKVLILAASITAEPRQNDRIVIRGSTFSVISVATDPAKAVWECHCLGTGDVVEDEVSLELAEDGSYELREES